VHLKKLDYDSNNSPDSAHNIVSGFKPNPNTMNYNPLISELNLPNNYILDKYSVLINKILESPAARISELQKKQVTISSKVPNTYSEFKVVERPFCLSVYYYAEFGKMGTKRNNWDFEFNTSQVSIYNTIHDWMLLEMKKTI
jgi:hypothetical protein